MSNNKNNHNIKIEEISENTINNSYNQKYIATHDALTDLPNRILLQEHIASAIEQACINNHLLAVFFMDLDGFKNINDKAGHAVGDLVLKETAQRLIRNTRSTDLVARLGGDEFVILLSRVENRIGVSIIADKILAAISSPYNIDSESWQISSSLGITIYPFDGLNCKDLLANADTAMYEAKRKGKNRAQYFNKQLNNVAKRKNDIIHDIRQSLVNNDFEILLQPQYDIQNNQIIGAESFIRWHHPKKGIVMPNKFLPYIANTEYINSIGYYVLNQAVELIKTHSYQGAINFRIAINVEPRQLANDDFINYLSELKNNGKPVEYLTIELTEECFKTNFEIIRKRLNRIRDLGIKICLDDFGIGISSLNQLITLPIDILKIDNKYFDSVHDDGKTKTGIIMLAQHLHIKVMAKRVDDAKQLQELIGLGCSYAQGYCYSPAISLVEFRDYYAKNFSKRDDKK